MVNTRKKGNRIERKAETRLKEKGFETSRMPHTRYGDSDHFNLYDIIALKPENPVRLIQVKTNSKPNMKQLKKDSKEIAPFKNVRVEAWTWYDYQGWVIDIFKPETDEWKTIEDQR